MRELTNNILAGHAEILDASIARWEKQAVDWEAPRESAPPPPLNERTIRDAVTITGPGTFFGKATRTLTFCPPRNDGWWFDRSDLPECLPMRVSVRNVWTTGEIVSNIVLRSGSPHNYIRMVEHMVALKVGLHLDHIMIQIDSGDPPIFDRGSLDLIEAIERAGIIETDRPARYVTVKEPVTAVDAHGGFLCLLPAAANDRTLFLDCAIDFPNAIGKQRIRFPVTEEHFRLGAIARTNTSATKKMYCRTVGKIFADIRNLGYTADNVLVAGKTAYVNPPKLMHEGKSLEAIWHRAVLDLLAAIALIDRGRFAGTVISYKAGHGLDVRLITQIYQHDMLTPL